MQSTDKKVSKRNTIRQVAPDACTGCSACASICPESCIVMLPDVEGFLHPQIDAEKCSNCGLCLRTCPVLKAIDPREPLAVYAAVNKDDAVRERSSSGGVFWELGKMVIEEGGVVCGAGWSEDLRVIHKVVDDLEGLKDLQGSKYVQSEIGETYKLVQTHLISGRQVLFSGTPCQVAGLRSFLGKEYDNLICVDLICHAVPSPGVFNKYKQELEQTYGSAPKRISFRHKNYGWKRFSMSIIFENNIEYLQPLDKDPFLRGFLNELYNRPCCHECCFRELRSGSDITLADYWNVHNLFPELDDDRGTSVILVNNVKGNEIWGAVSSLFREQVSDFVSVKKYNPAVYKSAACNNKRRIFYDANQTQPLEKTVKVLLKLPLKKQIRRILGKSYRFVFRRSH